MHGLTKRQQQIVDFIKSEINEKGYPPTSEEIGRAVGGITTGAVHGHLERLKKKGILRRNVSNPRAIELIKRPIENKDYLGVVSVPVVGRVTAGEPILAQENIEEYFTLPFSQIKTRHAYMLHVKGDSMKNAGILDGDYVIVQKQDTAENGDIVVAMVENDEATVKRFFRENGQFRLQPENDAYQPIIVCQLRILGKVIGMFRQITAQEDKIQKI